MNSICSNQITSCPQLTLSPTKYCSSLPILPHSRFLFNDISRKPTSMKLSHADPGKYLLLLHMSQNSNVFLKTILWVNFTVYMTLVSYLFYSHYLNIFNSALSTGPGQYTPILQENAHLQTQISNLPKSRKLTSITKHNTKIHWIQTYLYNLMRPKHGSKTLRLATKKKKLTF